MKRMKGLYLLNACLASIFSTLPPFISAQPAFAIDAQTLQELPNGNYLVCSDLPQQFPQEKNLAQAEASAKRKERLEKIKAQGVGVRQDNGLEDLPITKLINTCFEFSKSGNRVVGMYTTATKTTSWCVSGAVNGNAVSGFALSRGVLPPFYGSNSDQPNLNLTEVEPDLKVASVNISREGAFRYNGYPFQVGTVRYNRALLDLSKFYLINAKPRFALNSCENLDPGLFYNNAPAAQPEFFTNPGSK